MPQVGHWGGILSAAFSDHGRLVVTGSFDGTARIWDVETRRELLALMGSPEEVEAVAFSGDGPPPPPPPPEAGPAGG